MLRATASAGARLGPLLALRLAIQSLISGPAHAVDAQAGTWVVLDGRSVMEVRMAAGAQTPQDLARRISNELLLLAQDRSGSPDQLVVVDQPPYWIVAERHWPVPTSPMTA